MAALVVARAVRPLGCAHRRRAGRRPAAHVPARAGGVAGVPRVRRHRARLGPVPVPPHPLAGLGPHRRRVGRARRDVHRSHARARLLLGPAGVGHLVGVGRPPRDAPPSSSSSTSATSRCAASRAATRSGPRSAARSRRSSRSSTCRSCTSRSTGGGRCTRRGRSSTRELNAQIHGVMAFTLWFGTLAFTLVYVYLLDRRYRLAVLEEGREERELERAIAERTGVAVERGAGRHDRRRLRHHRLGAHRRGARRATRCSLAPAAAALPRRSSRPRRTRDRDRHTSAAPPPPPVPTPPPAAEEGPVHRRGRCLRLVVVVAVVLAVVLAENVVFFRTVSEAVADRDEPGKRPLPHRRRGGAPARLARPGADARSSTSPTARRP